MARVTVGVWVRDHTRAGMLAVRNSINNANQGILTGLRGLFSDGIGEAIASGIDGAMKNPYVSAALVYFVAAMVGVLATALSGALVLAFGGAFVALGVLAAKNSKRVQAAFGSALKQVKADFAGAAKPLEPVLIHAATLMKQLADEFAPQFKKAMADAAPHLTLFLDKVKTGISLFAMHAFDPMMKAFDGLLDEIDWTGFFDKLGQAFGHLGTVVDQNKKLVAGTLDAVLNLVPMAINLLADLTQAWAKVEPFVKENWRLVKILLTPAVWLLGGAFKILSDAMAAMAGPAHLVNTLLGGFLNGVLKPLGSWIERTFGPIWEGFISGFMDGWNTLETALVPVFHDLFDIMRSTGLQILSLFVPGLKDTDTWAKNAGKSIHDWVLNGMIWLSNWINDHRDEIKQWAQNIANGVLYVATVIRNDVIPALIKLGGWIWDHRWILGIIVTGIELIITAIDNARTLWGWAKRLYHFIVSMSGVTSISNAINLVKGLWQWVNRKWGRTVTFRFSGANAVITSIKYIWNLINRNWSRVISLAVHLSGPIDLARKLVGFAHGGIRGAATGGVRSNMTLVGEHGPELVDLAPGSHVRSNSDTRRILGGGNAGGAVRIMIDSSNNPLDRLLLKILREAIRTEGGNVQAVLGQGSAR